jgi:hypothetical protein
MRKLRFDAQHHREVGAASGRHIDAVAFLQRVARPRTAGGRRQSRSLFRQPQVGVVDEHDLRFANGRISTPLRRPNMSDSITKRVPNNATLESLRLALTSDTTW